MHGNVQLTRCTITWPLPWRFLDILSLPILKTTGEVDALVPILEMMNRAGCGVLQPSFPWPQHTQAPSHRGRELQLLPLLLYNCPPCVAHTPSIRCLPGSLGLSPCRERTEEGRAPGGIRSQARSSGSKAGPRVGICMPPAFHKMVLSAVWTVTGTHRDAGCCRGCVHRHRSSPGNTGS